MDSKTESVELDTATAAALKKQAADRGVSVSQLVSELVPLAVDDEVIAELDRRWAAIERGEATVSQADVEQWLSTWGTSDFRLWNGR